MQSRTCMLISTAALLGCLGLGTTRPATGAEPDKEGLIRDALRAAPPEVASTATVMDWDHKILKHGNGPYTCMPSDPDTRAKGGYNPMCLDQPWMTWIDALMGKKPFKADRVGIAYMLAGDSGASNTDPYATGPTPDNQWIPAAPPHTMVLLPDPAQSEGLSTDPNNGGAWVMWKGTPYVHVMVPVGARPAARQ